jgi:putative flippase GtrA
LSGARKLNKGGLRQTGAYAKLRKIVSEGAKFGIVGLIGIGVTNLVFGPLHDWLHLGVLTSVTIATAVATVVTYVGNRYWSFADREGFGTKRESVVFFMLNGIGLLIQYAVLGLSDHVLGLSSRLENYIALNIGIGLGTLFRFWSYRKWVWVPPEVHLARLRRGRHRKGRETPVPAFPGPAPPPSEPVLATVRLLDQGSPPRQRYELTRHFPASASIRCIGTESAAVACLPESTWVATSRAIT